jgi:hypothetical protein
MRGIGSAQYMGAANQELRSENDRLSLENTDIRDSRKTWAFCFFCLGVAVSFVVPLLHGLVTS